MILDIAKPGSSESALPKNQVRNAPASAGIPPHWADFYQLPVENDIIAGTDWIYYLWAVLHRATPLSYCAFRELDKTARKLCISLKLVIKAHTRTKTLHAVYDIRMPRVPSKCLPCAHQRRSPGNQGQRVG
ncbi:uncharacterized protein ARMOST_14556 [Armillaria ostoyae]|uniref:Uncharacterized protein n=1 Tax=Armillaria ostoyae TaxID=47428 RepID=A0A284RQY6_ARMOS|nr:uncharacterized protein ARMOST_14556 [Armillaria ostoyae]